MKQNELKVPIGDKLIVIEKNGEKISYDIEIEEVLDSSGHVVKWRFLQDEIIEKNGKDHFDVGDLFIDWINTSIRSESKPKDILRRCIDNDLNQMNLSVSGSIDYVYQMLISETHDSLMDLYRNMVEAAHLFKYDLCTITEQTSTGRKYIIKKLSSYTLQDSFFLIDLYELIKNSDISISRCSYCGEFFQSTKQSIKYCDKCRNDNIPEKLKNRGNTARQLRGKIYKRLMGRTNNTEYCPGIYDAFSFSEKAIEYRKNNPDKYYEWLQHIEELTR